MTSSEERGERRAPLFGAVSATNISIVPIDRIWLGTIFLLLIVAGGACVALVDRDESHRELFLLIADIEEVRESLASDRWRDLDISGLYLIVDELESGNPSPQAIGQLRDALTKYSDQLRIQRTINAASSARSQSSLDSIATRLRNIAKEETNMPDRVLERLTPIVALICGIVGLFITLRRPGPETEVLELQREKLREEIRTLRREGDEALF